MITFSGKSVLGAILGSVIISVSLMVALIYFGLPLLYPNVEEENVVLQTEYGEWNSEAYIFDNELAYKKMEDTELSISIQQNSRLAITFSAIAIMTLDGSFTGRVGYNYSIVVDGIGSRTLQVDYYDGNPATLEIRQFSINLFMNYMTEPLNAGTYTISLYWKSGFDAPGTGNSLSVAHKNPFGDYNFTRTLLVQELK